MTGMGAYIRTLREAQGITRAWVAEQVDTSETSLYRIEMGQQAPGTGLLISIVKAIKGSFDDVEVLIKGEKTETGALIANRRLQTLQAYADQQAREFRERVGPDQADAIARRLVNDPGFVDAIRRAAQQLLDG